MIAATAMMLFPGQSAFAQARSAYLSNLVATNQYQAIATQNAYLRNADAEMSKLRTVAETRRREVESLRKQLAASKGSGAQLQGRLEQAQQAAADAQLVFTAELARRDADYARERAALIQSGELILETEAGRRFLELVNKGDIDSWNEAKDIIEYDIQIRETKRKIEVAEDYRQLALQWLDKRDKGQETTENVIRMYEKVMYYDPTNPWDWDILSSLYNDIGNMSKARDAALRIKKIAQNDSEHLMAASVLGRVQMDDDDLAGAAESSSISCYN
ncbi:MAG: hypothetical protein WCY92_07875 [Novosphingobium sp.]